MKELKIGVLLLCFLIGINLVISDARPSVRTSRGIKEEVIEQIGLRNYQIVRNSVVRIRRILQDELRDDRKMLYASINSAKWRTNRNLFQSIDDEISHSLNLLEETTSLYGDIHMVQRLLIAGMNYRDLQALVDAYKILSDLENFFFYHNRREVFHGVTKTLSGQVKYKTTVLD